MTKPGPKPKPRSRRKDRIVGVRVTDAEYRKFERLAGRQHITVAAWARAQILLALEHAAEKGEITAGFEARQREQEETLAETKALLKETVRLYQSAAPSGTEKTDKR